NRPASFFSEAAAELRREWPVLHVANGSITSGRADLVVEHDHGLALFDQDVFVNAVGGVRIGEPAADLAVVLSVVSSLKNRPLPAGLAVFGEIGLAGEIRPAPRGQERLREAAKLGFSRALIPRANAPKKSIEGLETVALDRIDDALTAAWEA
ncbi:MAG: S16 family serine protease, partial [Quisquiliibacterium sp.]